MRNAENELKICAWPIASPEHSVIAAINAVGKHGIKLIQDSIGKMELKAQISLLHLQTLPEPDGMVFAFYTDECPFEDDFPWQCQEGFQIMIFEVAV